jgi:aspergillopepsin I
MVVFSKVTVVLAGLSAVASAVPHGRPAAQVHKGFTVNQQSRPVTKGRTYNAAGTYANALAKFGGSVPQSLKDAASKGSAVTTPEPNDVEYLTPVNVGGTTLNLDFDTGSADL